MAFLPHREKRRGEIKNCRPISTSRQACFQSAKTHDRPRQQVRAYSDYAINSNAMPSDYFLHYFQSVLAKFVKNIALIIYFE